MCVVIPEKRQKIEHISMIAVVRNATQRQNTQNWLQKGAEEEKEEEVNQTNKYRMQIIVVRDVERKQSKSTNKGSSKMVDLVHKVVLLPPLSSRSSADLHSNTKKRFTKKVICKEHTRQLNGTAPEAESE